MDGAPRRMNSPGAFPASLASRNGSGKLWLEWASAGISFDLAKILRVKRRYGAISLTDGRSKRLEDHPKSGGVARTRTVILITREAVAVEGLMHATISLLRTSMKLYECLGPLPGD